MKPVNLGMVALLGSGLATLSFAHEPIPATSKAGPADDSKLQYRGITINIATLPNDDDPEPVLTALKHQIDMVVEAKVKLEIAKFFLTVPVKLGKVSNNNLGEFRGRSIVLLDQPIPSNRGVLIHELIHAFHGLSATGDQKRQIAQFYREATQAYGLPDSEYFLTNDSEFFAVTTSIYLRGKSSHLPHTRQILKAVQPEYYKFLKATFDPQPTVNSPP